MLRANAHRRRSGRPAGTPRLSSQPDMVVAGRPRPQLRCSNPSPGRRCRSWARNAARGNSWSRLGGRPMPCRRPARHGHVVPQRPRWAALTRPATSRLLANGIGGPIS